jgi:hypothetical protein
MLRLHLVEVTVPASSDIDTRMSDVHFVPDFLALYQVVMHLLQDITPTLFGMDKYLILSPDPSVCA